MNDTQSLPIEKLIGQLNELSDKKLSESDMKAAYAAIDQYLKTSSSLESESRSATSETKSEWDEGLDDQAKVYRACGYSFSTAYKEHFSTEDAVADILQLEALNEQQPLSMKLYRRANQSSNSLQFKLYTTGNSLVLSDVIPILENLNMRVIGEYPYEVDRGDKAHFWMHDFTLLHSSGEPVDLKEVQPLFQEAFVRIWEGQAENDEFNRLVIGAKLTWREVAMLRAYARYNRQVRFGFSQPFIADTLLRHPELSRLLVELFRARYDPKRQTTDSAAAQSESIEAHIQKALEAVNGLNDDKILRRFLEMIKATLRTNYYQPDEQGREKGHFSFKISTRQITETPLPRPMFEVFIYSPRVEGVHLRFGKVARGGLRWSDRPEDYRTEVLGLVKAQRVKNAVIVPVGAKGGFVAKRQAEMSSREAIQAEGVACYKTFIRGLLDITDNLKDGEVISPNAVVCHDTEDPYLVVAADKGTATFSDTANAIAEEYGFWLGDAFASGGSQGFDHKAMGITARGAWESVKRHFRERDLNTQKDCFSVVAIGDMGGDVFGNGMLLSDRIHLLAAFNHLHIFVDPNPNPDTGFTERKRLFEQPRSAWNDYDASLISKGGGVFSRNAKSIIISPQMQERFNISARQLTPNELISALLKAPSDLIWNGGIGTYIKAASEIHADVGDKVNDSLRINGTELGCKVLGEGGNLGITQLGRTEFCLAGGAANTDFIDNAGGVDCSDHEVNIKILLNKLVSQDAMSLEQRNALLKDMTEEVAELVLKNNYNQVQAISIAQNHSPTAMGEYIHLINRLESEGKLDRELEFIPDNEVLTERRSKGLGLCRPELSVLISYTKAELKEALIGSRVTEDAYISREVDGVFPEVLLTRFPDAINNHPLRSEIVATQLANGLVNRMGITYAHSLRQTTGADYDQIAAAYVIAREVFGIDQLCAEINALDYQIPPEVQQTMIAELIRLTRMASRWFINHRGHDLDVTRCIEQFRPGVQETCHSIATLLKGTPLTSWQEKYEKLLEAGVSRHLARLTADADSLYALLGIIEVEERTTMPLDQVAKIYFSLGENLELHWFDQRLRDYDARGHWHYLLRARSRDDLNGQQIALTLNVIQTLEQEEEYESPVQTWMDQHASSLSRWRTMLRELRNEAPGDGAIYSVAIHELIDLTKRSASVP